MFLFPSYKIKNKKHNFPFLLPQNEKHSAKDESLLSFSMPSRDGIDGAVRAE